MLVLAVLILSLAVFRALGFAGITAFTSWHTSARDAKAVMLFFTASAHFTSMRDDLVRLRIPMQVLFIAWAWWSTR